jgi:hypothetical protein
LDILCAQYLKVDPDSTIQDYQPKGNHTPRPEIIRTKLREACNDAVQKAREDFFARYIHDSEQLRQFMYKYEHIIGHESLKDRRLAKAQKVLTKHTMLVKKEEDTIKAEKEKKEKEQKEAEEKANAELARQAEEQSRQNEEPVSPKKVNGNSAGNGAGTGNGNGTGKGKKGKHGGQN